MNTFILSDNGKPNHKAVEILTKYWDGVLPIDPAALLLQKWVSLLYLSLPVDIAEKPIR